MTLEELRAMVQSRLKPGDIIQITVKADKDTLIKDAVVVKIYPYYVQVKYLTEKGNHWLSTCLLYSDIRRRLK